MVLKKVSIEIEIDTFFKNRKVWLTFSCAGLKKETDEKLLFFRSGINQREIKYSY